MKDLLRRTVTFVRGLSLRLSMLVIGVVIGVALVVGSEWLAIISAVGTFGAAIAAFVAVHFANLERVARENSEDEIRKPYLRIPSVRVTPKSADFTFRFVNLSQQAVFVSELLLEKPEKRFGNSWLENVDVELTSGSAVNHKVNLQPVQFEFTSGRDGGEGALRFYFNYAMTGSRFYYLRLPIEVTKKNAGNTYVKFLLSEQEVVGPTDPPFSAWSVELGMFRP